MGELEVLTVYAFSVLSCIHKSKAYAYSSRNLKSCFHPRKTHPLRLPQNKICTKKVPDSHRREFRGIVSVSK